MKSLLQPPSFQEGPAVVADYAEILALDAEDRNISQQDLIERFKRPDEESTEKCENAVQEAFVELAERSRHMGCWVRHYPFELDRDLLKVKESPSSKDTDLLYVFLLLVTRMNMKNERKQKTSGGARLDGTQIFEHLCCEVARRYWGGSSDSRVGAIVFGTAGASWRRNEDKSVHESRFKRAIDDLCNKIGEGSQFWNKDKERVTAKDDKVDVVVWRGFSDGRRGKLLGFGQCKTGDSWEYDLPRLQPRTFCERWMLEMPLVVPVKLFFLSDRVVDRWNTHGYEAGILFDRCRILDYAEQVPKQILSWCVEWTRAALESKGLKW
jgi:hypothetical protein